MVGAILLFLLIISVYSIDERDQSNFYQYLRKYGFVQETSNSLMSDESVMRNAVMVFQDYYKFYPVDGVIRPQMIEFTKDRRCGVSDSPLNYVLRKTKWNKSSVTWHFPRASTEVRHLVETAFSRWSMFADINFYWSVYNPDILISYKSLNHSFEDQPGDYCGEFDGNGGVLGHAYFPTKSQNGVEIHLDADEDWYYGLDYPQDENKISFLAVLIHEIGHSIGIEHSPMNESIMFSTYRVKAPGQPVTLYSDDILGVNNLYGSRRNEETTTTTTRATTRRAISTTAAVAGMKPKGGGIDIPKKEIDLCNLKSVDGMLIVNGRMYIFYKKWVWAMDLGSKNYESPKVIRDWLTFLPDDFKRITTIYQRPNNDVALIHGNMIYLFSIPDLKLRDGWPKSIHEVWTLNDNMKVRGLVHTYMGRTLLFYDDNYYANLNECYFQPFSFGLPSNDFNGLPVRFKSVFRYTNGLLYFFDKNNYYEYDEFKNMLVKSGKFNWELFNIQCVKENVLDQIKNLLLRLSNMYHVNNDDDDDDDDK